METKLTEKLARQVLLGTAVGDSVGLPAEGMSRKAIARRWRGVWRQRLVFGCGMVSDDTEHTVFVAQALCRCGGEAEIFRRLLARRLRWWFACLPPGVGLATARSILRLWCGVPPIRSGVFSGGNGAAMRSALIGAYFAGNPRRLEEFVHASTRMTHSDPKAQTAALAVAVSAAAIVSAGPGARISPLDILAQWRACGANDPEWLGIMDKLKRAFLANLPVAGLAAAMGLEKAVSGYAYHSVPVALYSWQRHQGDYATSLTSVFDCGGDTDSVGAICGALAALQAEIPPAWLAGLRDWPLSRSYLDDLAKRLVSGSHGGISLRWAAYPLRNVVLLVVVLAHALRRILP
jgi:ADP-ribosylglycohydrolase